MLTPYQRRLAPTDTVPPVGEKALRIRKGAITTAEDLRDPAVPEPYASQRI